ncbi:MAG: inositol monophosphatase family protein [Acidobacteriota bacterium]
MKNSQTHPYQRFEQVGIEVAREAGRYLMSRFRQPLAVAHKGEVDLVTEVDIAAEKMILARLSGEFPSHTFMAEEQHPETRSGNYRWIIDPLDGTTNYAHGLPAFAVSLGLEVDGRVRWGVVYDPCQEEMFLARQGGGAWLNGRQITVSKQTDLGVSLLATGFPYDIRTSSRNNLDHFHSFALRALAIRRIGSAALDLCYLAAGRFDGFWELSLHAWDCAAGYLIVREAGGKVSNFSGEEGSIYDQECVASNSLIHQQMLDVIRGR